MVVADRDLAGRCVGCHWHEDVSGSHFERFRRESNVERWFDRLDSECWIEDGSRLNRLLSSSDSSEPEVSGVAVLRVGRISESLEEIEVVTIETSGTTWELMDGGGAEVVDSTVPKVADASGKGALSVIQLMSVNRTGHSCFFLNSAGAAEIVSACTMVSHVNDFIVRTT